MAPSPLRIVLPGGSGHLGRILAWHFHEQGHSVTVISRHPGQGPWRCVRWDGFEIGDWARVIDRADVVINLAGKNVNCRYNAANRREIKHSRVVTTALIGEAIAQAAYPPAVWLNASTCTIYKHCLDRAMDESGEFGGKEPDAPAKWAFSVDVALSWERALMAANTPHTRKVAMRSAMVMSPEPGGVFDRLLHLIRMGLGGTLGPGDQFVSWIHDADFIRAVEFLIQHQNVEGPVNVCSPCPVPNHYFMRCLRHAWCTTYIGVPAPRWMLAVGAVALRTETELFLKSRRVVPGILKKNGFEFHFPNWRGAAQDLVHRWRGLQTDACLSAAAL